jgi:hypothetical protein
MPEHIRDSYEFPTDLPDEGDGAGDLRWTVGVIVTTAALLALTNAEALSDWAATFDPQPGMLAVMRATDGWQGTTAQLGLGLPHARMHQAWKQVEAAHWSEGKTPSRTDDSSTRH